MQHGRGIRGVKMSEGGQMVEASSYTINKSWRYNLQHGGYRPPLYRLLSVAYLNVAKRVNH